MVEQSRSIDRPVNPAHELRRALELICRKTNPPFGPATQRISLERLGVETLPWAALPLDGASLRGLEFGEADFSTARMDALDAADLEGADLSRAKVAGLAFNRARLINASVPTTAGLEQCLTQNRIRSDLPPILNVSATQLFPLAVLSDGRLASGGYQCIHLWDLAQCMVVATLKGHGGWVRALAPLPDGRLASTGEDGVIRLWDIAQGGVVATLEGHSGWVMALALLPDGRLASGGMDGWIRLWHQERVAAMLCGFRTGLSCQVNSDGVSYWNPNRPWRTLKRGEQRIPVDPDLHRLAGFNLDHQFAVPLYCLPERLRWHYREPELEPRGVTISWPKDFDVSSLMAGSQV